MQDHGSGEVRGRQRQQDADARFISEAEWNATVNVNLIAVFNLTQAVLEDMIARKEGAIITVSLLAVVNPTLLWWCRLRGGRGRREEFHDIPAQHLPQPGHPRDDHPAWRDRYPDHGQSRPADKGAMIPELHICPTFMRDNAADIKAARWVGAPEGLADKPKS